MSPLVTDRPSPFQPAEATSRRLKLFLWGDTGVGKTTLALRFPHPVVIDREGSAACSCAAPSCDLPPESEEETDGVHSEC